MSKYPSEYDDDTTLPPVNDNITEIGEEAINAAREAIFNLELEVGLGASGTKGSLADRLGVSIGPDGYIIPSALTSLGLVTLPITNSQIANNANIPESKLLLDHRTADLFNYSRDLARGVNEVLGWISITGIKLEPHIVGAIYKHQLHGIDVSLNGAEYFRDRFNQFRDNTNAYLALNGLNTEVVNHQQMDGSGTSTSSVPTKNGGTYPADYAHTSAGIFLDTSRFSVIPQTAEDMQQFAQYLDDASIFLYGTRIQNFYSNGVSRASRSAVLTQQARGMTIVPSTQVTTHLLNNGSSSSPVDDIELGDDIVEFTPASSATANYLFDSQFALAKVGDVVRINYGTVEVPFLLKEKKYIPGSPARFMIRLSGKNLYYKTDGYATIERTLYHINKYGVLAIAAANNSFNEEPSLIAVNPTGAMTLGVGFNADLLDSTHYNLYLALYPTGNPDDGVVPLEPIDVTGNLGATPGKYTLDSIVETINDAFRQPGYNYRFVAFSYEGEFGIALADPYNNAAFSVLDGVVDSLGDYDQTATELAYPNNVIGLFGSGTLSAPDPLGYSSVNGAISSPAYSASFSSSAQSLYPTKLYVPLERNNYYVNGTERDKLTLEEGQTQDGYGFGYWSGEVVNRVETPAPNGKVSTTYRIYDNVLSSVNLKNGSTIVVQPLLTTDTVDFGRFIISDVTFVDCGTSCYTDITVYDAVHNTGVSPYASADDGYFALYFNSSSISFNNESATDHVSRAPFKRHFQVYIDENAKTFTHERGRFTNGGSNITVNSVTLRSTTQLSKMELIDISPKLRGYQFGDVTKITLHINLFNTTTGNFDGYLASYDGTNLTHIGPTTNGKQGQTARFYDETNVDYIDILFASDTSMSTVVNENIDIQLFPSIESDGEIMLLAKCQYNTLTNYVNYLRDERQFGNISEEELSSSALDYISLPDKMLHQNGVLRGFGAQDVTPTSNPNSGQIYLDGGLVLVGGKLLSMNHETVAIPLVKESYSSSFYNVNWALCVNSAGEYETIPLLDYDPILSTPNANRRFYAYNPVTTSSYYIESSYFSDIVNNRKDLTPIYIVASTVSGTTISLELHDVRKFVNDGDANDPLRYSSGTVQGSFKSVESILNWITYNNGYNGNVELNGASETISSAVYLNTNGNGQIVIDGENNSSLTFTNNVYIGSNVTLKNLTLTFQGLVTISSENITFENCSITFLPAAGSPPSSNIVFTANNPTNLAFRNCDVIANYSLNSASSGGAIFYLSGADKFTFSGGSVIAIYNYTSGVYYPGNVFEFVDDCSNVVIENVAFSGNYNRCVSAETSVDQLTIRNCSMESIYVPAAELSYDATDLVNTGNGYIYVELDGTNGTSANGIVVDNVTFNFNPSTASNNRFSFINFELYMDTIMEDVKIENCKFNNESVGSTVDDFRAAVSIINIYTTYTGAPPILKDAHISNNRSNRHQFIVLTSTTYIEDGAKYMSPLELSAQNCVIENNVCGAIGYWIGEGIKYENYSPQVTTQNNKQFGLSIVNNTCNSILCMDSTGEEYAVARYSTVDLQYVTTCPYASSNVIIRDNKTSWITVSCAYETGSSLQIVNNTLTATKRSYVDVYNISSNTRYTEKLYYAIHVDGNVNDSTDTDTPKNSSNESCIISENIIGPGYFYDGSSTPIVYAYQYGAIWVRTSATITDNIYKAAAPSAFTLVNVANVIPIIISNGNRFRVTGNQLVRGSTSVGNYIGFKFLTDYPTFSSEYCEGTITENIFDSPITNGTNTDTINMNIDGAMNLLSRWIIERNINQTISVRLRPGDGRHYTKNVTDGYDAKFWALDTGVTPSFGSNYNSVEVFYNGVVASSKELEYGIIYELTNRIPKGAKIVEIQYICASTAYAGAVTKYQSVCTIQNQALSGTKTTNLPNATQNNSITLTAGTDFSDSISNDHVNAQSYLMIDYKLVFDSLLSLNAEHYYINLKYRW